MAKSKKTDKGRLKDGRGTGIKENYKPWLKPVEVPSTGKSTRTNGLKISRINDFLSLLEKYFFIIYEWQEEVVDIREQFPLLPLIKTEQIARKMRYRHPSIVKKIKIIKGVKNSPKITIMKNIVMSTDFLVTINDEEGLRDIARTIKYKKELENNRVREKLLIEKEYWESKKINWKCVTEEYIPIVLAKNLLLVRSLMVWLMENRVSYIQVLKIEREIYKKLGEIKFGILDDGTINLINFCREIEKEMNYKSGFVVNVFKALIWTKDIEVDLTKKLDFNKLRVLNMKRGDKIETIKFKRYYTI